MNHVPTIKIVRGPHLLYTGTNGLKTFGIIVENLTWSPGCAYQREYAINDHSIAKWDVKNVCVDFDISFEELLTIQAEVESLVKNQ